MQMLKLNGEVDWSDGPYHVFAKYVKAAAAKLGVEVSIGAFWPRFVDAPHTELKLWRTM
ncbi:MAG: hypothetical protein H7242_02445 [Microbacteriaceae bacterium]|nr:hypothetical protein [Burkholderiaceae bacterium]